VSRKRFSEKDVIKTLILTGNKVYSYRSKQQIGLADVDRIEREHITPIALGGKDEPENCGYSLSEEHSIQTNGKPHTSYGSDKHVIAKTKRLQNPKVSKHPLKSTGKKIPSRPFQRRAV
jgi:hypothetical protein